MNEYVLASEDTKKPTVFEMGKRASPKRDVKIEVEEIDRDLEGEEELSEASKSELEPAGLMGRY